MGVEFVDISDSKKLTGLYIAFTQEFFDGTGPPPSALFDYPFIFGGEVSPLGFIEDVTKLPGASSFRASDSQNDGMALRARFT